MKNRKLLLIVSLVLALTMSLGGTLAYLQDTDSDVNVMTLGNVQIEQHEYQRVEEDGKYTTDTIDEKTSYVLEAFEQNKPLLPIVGDPSLPGNDPGYAGWDSTPVRMSQVDSYGGMDVFAGKNAVDKFVTVENTGKTDAYVRTIVAVEVGSTDGSLVGTSYHGTWTKNEIGKVTINGNGYNVFEYVYAGAKNNDGSWLRHDNGVLPAGDTTYPNLAQVYLKAEANNEDMVAIDGNQDGMLNVLVVSQAVQAAGFADAKTALDTAFGVVSKDSHPWNDQEPAIKVVSAASDEELANAIETNEDAVINLSAGEYTTNLKIAGGKDITIVGTKDTVLSGQIATTSSEEGTLTLRGVTVMVDDSIKDSTGISQTGKSAIAIWGNQTVICENVTFEMSKADSTAITSWWDTGIGTSIIVKNCTFNCNGQRPIRATGNVTVENCTFNDPYRYAVQLTAKADTATLLDKAVINFKNNTIVNGENGKAFVYGIQLEGADYGCNDLVINGAGNTIVDGGADSAMYYCECGKVVHDTIEWNVETDAIHEQ